MGPIHISASLLVVRLLNLIHLGFGHLSCCL